MKNYSCTLKIGPTYHLSLQRMLCKRHYHYWSQKERTPFFSSKGKEHHNGQKKENTLSLLLNFHKTTINKIVIGYKYNEGEDDAVVSASPMWPGFESKPWHQMWVEFALCSLPCSERSVLL